MKCKYASIRKYTDTGALVSISICDHPNYERELADLAKSLSEHGKTLTPNKECQFVRDLDYTQCPLYKGE